MNCHSGPVPTRAIFMASARSNIAQADSAKCFLLTVTTQRSRKPTERMVQYVACVNAMEKHELEYSGPVVQCPSILLYSVRILLKVSNKIFCCCFDPNLSRQINYWMVSLKVILHKHHSAQACTYAVIRTHSAYVHVCTYAVSLKC